MARSPCFSYRDDFFRNETRIIPAHSWTGDATQSEWLSVYFPSNVKIEDQLVLWLTRKDRVNAFGNVEGQGATIATTRWFQYGTVTARMKMAKGRGVVSSIVLRGSDGADGGIEDEIDWEWVGSRTDQVQSNFYYWQILSHDHGQYHTLPNVDLSLDFHEYTLEWMPDYLTWKMDGKVLRTLFRNQTWDETLQKYKYPSRESRLAFSLWDGGSQSEGTSKWAGGLTVWNETAPPTYRMVVDWVKIDCHYKGNTSRVFTAPPMPLPTVAPPSHLGTGNTLYQNSSLDTIVVNLSSSSKRLCAFSFLLSLALL
jgi:beta-glucanase (GH16 family)